MRIADIIGRVTLSRCHPTLRGAVWLVAVPLSAEGLRDRARGRGEPVVVYDQSGGSPGDLIAVSEGAEAAAPFHPEVKPVDAYNAAILENVRVTTP